MLPRLFFISSILGNSADNCSPLTSPRSDTCIGWLRASSCTCVVKRPRATPKSSGASFRRALSITACTRRVSSGTACGRSMRSPVNCRSRSILSQRAVSNGSSGSTLPALGRRSGWFELAPTSGPRSCSRSSFERIVPSSRGRGWPEV